MAMMWNISVAEAESMLAVEDVAIDPDNWLSFKTWQAVCTQWIYGAMGGVVGLDYSGVQVVLGLTVKRKQRAQVFADLQLMERTALPLLNEKPDK